ncbi:MAG TPA: serine hydrolase domain-containing protein [Myxococcota bacterium]|nr:serine hydrolase domain-containing protein [Myxococcota bacterium]
MTVHAERAGRQGFDPDRLRRVEARVASDIAEEHYDGCELVVARRGDVVLEVSAGFADRAAGRRVESPQPFVTMSVGKQFTVATVLQRIERGELAFTTRVADVIPEFGCRGKDRISLAQVLTHTSGLAGMLPGLAPEQVGDLEAVVAATCASLPESEPGTRVNYSVIVGHAILAELVRRIDGSRRAFRDIVREDLFEPLGMGDTSLGARPDLAKRLAPVVVRDRRPGLLEPELLEFLGNAIDEHAEIPAGGYVSTARDLHRFAEMLRRGGELDGARLLSPLLLERVRQNQTGDAPNSLWDYAIGMRGWDPFPASLGLGFFLRGEGMHPTPFGTLASPETFGGFGAGSAAFWIDPEREISYAFLSAGLIEETYSLERHQRLSDLVFTALT